MARLLIIDDDVHICQFLQLLLQSEGHEVAIANDGNEGIRLQGKKPFELIITDIFMPNKEGMETISDLKRDYATIPIIAISGTNMGGKESHLRFAQKLGADMSISKPITKDILISAVDALLGSNNKLVNE